jgi:hypothetical protein
MNTALMKMRGLPKCLYEGPHLQKKCLVMKYVFFLSLYITKILKQKTGGYDVLNAHKQ